MQQTVEHGSNSELSPNKAFWRAFRKTTTDLEYDSSWHDGSGFIADGSKVELSPGARARAFDIHSRPILFIGTRFGTIVVYKKYQDDDSQLYLVTWPVCFPPLLKKLFVNGVALRASEIETICGSEHSGTNIGFVIERFAALVVESRK